jgi:hypothetical protein
MSFYCLPSSSSIWPSAREAHYYEGGFQIVEDLLSKLSDSSNPLPPRKACSVIIDKIVEKRKSDQPSIPKGHTLESLPARQRRVQQLPKAEGRALMSFDFRRSSEVTFDDCR